MIDPNKMMANFEAQDGYIASLQAEAGRLRAKYQRLEDVARGIAALHEGKEGGLGQWKELREALEALSKGVSD